MARLDLPELEPNLGLKSHVCSSCIEIFSGIKESVYNVSQIFAGFYNIYNSMGQGIYPFLIICFETIGQGNGTSCGISIPI